MNNTQALQIRNMLRITSSAAPRNLHRRQLSSIQHSLAQTVNVQHDDAQRRLATLLDALQPKVVTYITSSNNTSIQPPPRIPKGIYIHGSVGTGKTMLVDMFYRSLVESVSATTHPNAVKRIHFHDFMRQTQRRIHAERTSQPIQTRQGSLQAIGTVADALAREASVYILDEFFISDVAETLLIMPLLTGMLRPSHRRGIVLITTSNTAPVELAKGLENIYDEFQRVFVSNVLLKHVRVFDMASTMDYRSRSSVSTTTTRAQSNGQQHTNNFIVSHDPNAAGYALIPSFTTTTTWQYNLLVRNMNVPSAFGRTLQVECAWTDGCLVQFEWLCGHTLPALGPGDYAALCDLFQHIIVTNVPRMQPVHFGRDGDSARRFALFLDVAYDRRTNVIVTSSSNELFDQGPLKSDEGENSPVIDHQEATTTTTTTTDKGRWSSDQTDFKPETAMQTSAVAAFRRAKSRWNEMSRGIVRR